MQSNDLIKCVLWKRYMDSDIKGRKQSLTTRRKISDALKGEKHPNFGKRKEKPPKQKKKRLPVTDITREKLSIAHRGQNSSTWKGGVSFLPYCFKFNIRRRRAVRNFFQNKCICCGKHAIENIIRWKTGYKQQELHAHHVNHDKEEGCNDKPFNLVPLCKKCHSKELYQEKEYKEYINKTLEEGFKWGIWSREQYELEVMYLE